jgi:hypothetical protein
MISAEPLKRCAFNVHTWLEFDAVVIIIIVVRTLGNVAGERRVAGLHSTLWFPFARLNAILFHSRWPVNAMQLEIKTARIADWLAHRIATPKRRHRRLAIAARETNAPRSRLRKHKIVIAHNSHYAMVFGRERNLALGND